MAPRRSKVAQQQNLGSGGASDSAMADVIKHSSQWDIQNPRDGQMETKSFVMQVRDLEVRCIANFFKDRQSQYYHGFAYELTWPDCDRQPLLYSGQVEVFQNGASLWTDKKATPTGGHVCSSKLFPRGNANLYASYAVTITFNFEFNLQDRVEKSFMSMLKDEKSFMSMMKDKILTDVVVVCEEKTFDCHKIILAKHSEVFEKMLTGTFKEANEGKIIIKDFTPDVVKLMIDFVYSSDVPENSVTWELFEAAKMYALPSLQNKCLRSLRKGLSVDNSCKMLEATFKHGLDEMFDFAMKFVKNNKHDVARTDGWAAVTDNNKLLAKILIHLM